MGACFSHNNENENEQGHTEQLYSAVHGETIYEQRLFLLVTGYIRNKVESVAVPTDIAQECLMRLRQQCLVEFLKYYSTFNTAPLQIWIEGDDLGLFSSIVHRYEIRYISKERLEKIVQRKLEADINAVSDSVLRCLQANEEHLKHSFTSKIFPFQCVSFTEREESEDTVSCDTSGHVYVQIMALDRNANSVLQSQWKRIYVNVNSVSEEMSDGYEAVRKFWNEQMAINRHTMTVTEWVAWCAQYMSEVNVSAFQDRHDEEGDGVKHAVDEPMQELQDRNHAIAHRMFYFILFLGNNRKEMTLHDFDKFVGETAWAEYNDEFYDFIGRLRRMIPNL